MLLWDTSDEKCKEAQLDISLKELYMLVKYKKHTLLRLFYLVRYLRVQHREEEIQAMTKPLEVSAAAGDEPAIQKFVCNGAQVSDKAIRLARENGHLFTAKYLHALKNGTISAFCPLESLGFKSVSQSAITAANWRTPPCRVEASMSAKQKRGYPIATTVPGTTSNIPAQVVFLRNRLVDKMCGISNSRTRKLRAVYSSSSRRF